MTDYRYLFPYEKIPPGSKILIYGAGLMGQEYLKQMLITGYAKVIGFADRRYAEYKNMAVPVYAPAKVSDLEFDYVVVALRGGFDLPAIEETLKTQGVTAEKIICVFERLSPEINKFISKPVAEFTPAYNNHSPTLALYLSGGFGDLINHKRFIMELLRLVPSAKIDLYAVQHIEFIKWLYSDVGAVCNSILDLGSEYQVYSMNYDLAVGIFGSTFLKVDIFNSAAFSAKFVTIIEKLQKRCQDEAMSLTIPAAVAYYRRILRGVNCYTWFNYGDVFGIKDWRVTIPFLKEYNEVFSRLKLENYYTINASNGTCAKGNRVAKAWPRERFEAAIVLLKEKYPDLKAMQIGAKGEIVLTGADRVFLGEHFGLVAFILKNAKFHLDIEGGLVHLASQIGTKCIVLFGPTSVAYNGYENNINIITGNCHDCYGLHLDMGKCARHMREPECMYSITPEMVLERIELYLATELNLPIDNRLSRGYN